MILDDEFFHSFIRKISFQYTGMIEFFLLIFIYLVLWKFMFCAHYNIKIIIINSNFSNFANSPLSLFQK